MAPPAPNSSGFTLRVWGAILLVLFVLTSAVGGSLSLESSYLLVTLASHVGLAFVTVAIAGFCARVLSPQYGRIPRTLSRLAALSAGVAFLGGLVFLLAGQSPFALAVMTGFALLGMITSLLLIVYGGPSGRIAAAASAPTA